MPCFVDVPGRPILFPEGKGRRSRSGGEWRWEKEWEERMEGKLNIGYNISEKNK